MSRNPTDLNVLALQLIRTIDGAGGSVVLATADLLYLLDDVSIEVATAAIELAVDLQLIEAIELERTKN